MSGINAKPKTRCKNESGRYGWRQKKNTNFARWLWRRIMKRLFYSTTDDGGGGWRLERAVQRETAQGSVVDRAPDCGSTRPWVSLCLVAQYCCACARRPIFARAHTHALFTRYNLFAVAVVFSVRTYTRARAHKHTHARGNSNAHSMLRRILRRLYIIIGINRTRLHY